MDTPKDRIAIGMRRLQRKLDNASRSKIKRLLADPAANFPKPFRLTDSHNAPLLWWLDEIDAHLLSRARVVTIGDVPRMGNDTDKSGETKDGEAPHDG